MEKGENPGGTKRTVEKVEARNHHGAEEA